MTTINIGGQNYHIDEEQRRKTMRELDRVDYEQSLYKFLKAAWRYIDPAPFKDGWVLGALAEHLEAVVNGEIRRLIINIPPRCSKPVAATERVHTQEFGLIPLSEVVPGMHVLTHRNRFRRVSAVHRQGVLATQRLTTKRGRTIAAAPDHPFYTTDRWRELRYITPGDRVGVVPQFDHLRSGRPTISEETARLLGYLVGDGACYGTPNVTVADDIESADIHHVVRAAGFAPTEQTYHMAKTGYVLRRIGIRSVAGTFKRPTRDATGPVRQFLLKHNMWRKSSYTKRIPEEVMRGDEDVACAFLGAYWACDGFINYREKDRLDFVIGCDSVSLEMLRDVQMLLLRLGIDSIIRRKEAKIKTKKQGDRYVSYSLTLSDQYNCWQFARRIHIKHTKDVRLTPLRICAAPDFPRDIVPDIVESNVSSDAVECLCLTVEGDESFVVNGFAVHNSSICSVAFPAWVWAQSFESATSGPGVPMLFASYSYKLARRDSQRTRRLIKSPWYQSFWGERVVIEADKDQVDRFGNTRQGERMITSVDGGVTGEGGNIIVADDPNNAREVLSEAIIETTNQDWWDGAMSTRLNDAETGAYVVVQQRLGELDLTGHITAKEPDAWTHLMLPMEYEPVRSFTLTTGWKDPRTEPGELLWPERFTSKSVEELKRSLGKWRAAGQLQQRPEPAEGGIIKRNWWNLWPPGGEETDENGRVLKVAPFPPMDYIMASVDTALTEKTMNDPSAITIWGIFTHGQIARPTKTVMRDGTIVEQTLVYDQRAPAALLMHAWQGHLELNELVNHLHKLCRHGPGGFYVDMMLVENKGAGHSVEQELRRLFRNKDYMVRLTDPGRVDKTARLYSIQHLFAEGLVWAPDRTWAEEVIGQCGTYPNAQHDDLVDTVSQGLKYLRANGMLSRAEEVADDVDASLRFINPKGMQKLYPG